MSSNRNLRKQVKNSDGDEVIVGLRIIGGSLRRRKLEYSGDLRTRPMKDRVREAVFNLLGAQVSGSHAIDLFAGTGALGIEAISRGATRGTFIERHFPTTKLIEQNAAALGIADKVQVVFGDAFGWSAAYKSSTDAQSLTVFCSPPYDFYVERQQQMLDLIARWIELSPAASQIVVEADERFPMGLLPRSEMWDVRTYPPAVVGILSTEY
jgi:16S rRNA (guanine(966)-N(2))-methyltransferase RsmD